MKPAQESNRGTSGCQSNDGSFDLARKSSNRQHLHLEVESLPELTEEMGFMLNRDEPSYISRQAESCLFLVKKYDAWIEAMRDRLQSSVSVDEQSVVRPTILVLSHLRRVHIRQWEDLGRVQCRARPSWYLGQLYERMGLESISKRRPYDILIRVLVHHVMYVRGRLRYQALLKAVDRETALYWRLFLGDATSNALMLGDLATIWHRTTGSELMENVIGCETGIIREIEEHRSVS